MARYKCGHETDGVIILDSNELSMAGYLEWVDSVGIMELKKYVLIATVRQSQGRCRDDRKM